MYSFTLAELRAAVSASADVPIGDNRITSARANDMINRAIVRYERKKSEMGLADIAQASLSTSTSDTYGTDGFQYKQTVDLPADFSRVSSLYALNTGIAARYQVQEIPKNKRMSLSSFYGETNGPPRGFDIVNPNSESDLFRLRLWPTPSQVYELELTYEVFPTKLTVDAQPWTCLPDTEDLVIATVARDLLAADGATQTGMIQMLEERIAIAQEALESHGDRGGGVVAMVDDSSRRSRRIRWWFDEV